MRDVVQLAAELWSIAKTPNMARDWGEERIAALLRERDAEHEAARREERGRAFDAGVDALRERERSIRSAHELVTLDILNRRVAAARRAAVESAPPSPAEETAGHGVSVEQMQRAIDKVGPEGGWAVAEDAPAEETSGG